MICTSFQLIGVAQCLTANESMLGLLFYFCRLVLLFYPSPHSSMSFSSFYSFYVWQQKELWVYTSLNMPGSSELHWKWCSSRQIVIHQWHKNLTIKEDIQYFYTQRLSLRNMKLLRLMDKLLRTEWLLISAALSLT